MLGHLPIFTTFSWNFSSFWNLYSCHFHNFPVFNEEYLLCAGSFTQLSSYGPYNSPFYRWDAQTQMFRNLPRSLSEQCRATALLLSIFLDYSFFFFKSFFLGLPLAPKWRCLPAPNLYSGRIYLDIHMESFRLPPPKPAALLEPLVLIGLVITL